MPRFVAVVVFAVLCLPSLASAQSRWGVHASFAPSWKIPDQARELFDADTADVQGSEFRVGIVRGRTLGGEWGLSFVQKSVKDGSFTDNVDFRRTASDMIIRGVAIEKFAVISTIKERVQIGVIFGAGAATASGTVTEEDHFTGEVREIDAKSFATPFGVELPVVPLARLELSAAAIVARGFKVRVSGGFNYPDLATVSIGGVYLFGGR